jgi:hypothetical protein
MWSKLEREGREEKDMGGCGVDTNNGIFGMRGEEGKQKI